MSNVENISSHMAKTCKCGSVNFSLLRSGEIECNFCTKKLTEIWVSDVLLGRQVRRAIHAEDKCTAMEVELHRLAAENKVLRDALEDMLDGNDKSFRELCRQARAALGANHEPN